MNNLNFGIVTGRMTKAVKSFENKDGSKKVYLTVAARDNFKRANGEVQSQFVQLEALVKKGVEGLGVFDYLSTGDLVSVQYTVRSQKYKDKANKDVYAQVLFIEGVTLMESKANAEKHRAKEQGTAAAPATANTNDEAITTDGLATAEDAEEVPFA